MGDESSNAGRRALACFVAVEVIAFPLLLVWGRRGWFTQDDWDFLSARTIGNAGDLFRAHYEHWTTLPIVAYRLLWVTFGIRNYSAYQSLVVALHLCAAALLLAVMRRAGVRPWLATAAAVSFVFFGSGAENILVAFQITFVGSLAFGLAQLLLADHDGPIARRDYLGLLAGFAGLLCSGVAATMTVVVGLALLLRHGRRGWRAALFHTAPLAAAYLLWLGLAPKGQTVANYRTHSPTRVIRFVWIGIESAFARFGQIPGVGIVLALVLIAGFVLLSRERGLRARYGSLAVPVALLAGCLVFLLVTGVTRSGQGGVLAVNTNAGPERAHRSRYVYLVVAMALPALAIGADALIRRWRQLAIPMAVMLLAGLPGNIHLLSDPSRFFANALGSRAPILAVPRLPHADQLRHSREPIPIERLVAQGLTFGWLVDSVHSGRIPRPPSLDKFQISAQVVDYFLRPGTASHSARCVPAPPVSVRVLRKDQALTVKGGSVFVVYLPLGGVPSPRRLVKPSTLVALVGPLRLRIIAPGTGVSICA